MHLMKLHHYNRTRGTSEWIEMPTINEFRAASSAMAPDGNRYCAKRGAP